MDNVVGFSAAIVDALPNLRAFAFSLVRSADRADDLVQDTMVKAWNKRESFTEGTNLRAWLFTILRNTYFSELRKRRREIEDVEGKMAERLATLPEQEGHLDIADFNTAFGMLNADQREALTLIGAEGFSYEEAAEICGCAIGTLKSRVNRARARLIEILRIDSIEEYGPDANTRAIVGRRVAAHG